MSAFLRRVDAFWPLQDNLSSFLEDRVFMMITGNNDIGAKFLLVVCHSVISRLIGGNSCQSDGCQGPYSHKALRFSILEQLSEHLLEMPKGSS